jgi:hypothetical protein
MLAQGGRAVPPAGEEEGAEAGDDENDRGDEPGLRIKSATSDGRLSGWDVIVRERAVVPGTARSPG